eukprot:GFKZ01014460.1.p1 GENE.GFKZ01014460.1~~GFKZ01014460.1.p1  ORF type:complete len:1142 (-),score=197.75 GFKZ01014460.1:107-3121(-)
MPRSIGIRVESSAAPKPSDASTKLGESPHQLKTSCRHDVSLPACYPDNYDFDAHSMPDDFKPAKEYPFTLDAFQSESIKCLERNESVLVAAHTSAGKTVVAEYAIALALREKQRVIYTSPIKALSNQKYRELEQEFTDVGLMTGDVTINKNASCLVMTTEILRSMLYRGSEIVREVSWVIFDEVHYMRDRERGVVWEETIILVPQNVRFVFLSATIPNAREFAEWIAHLKNQPCHTIYTGTRPVPLQHFLFAAGGKGLHHIVDEKGQFRSEAFQAAMNEMGSAKANGGGTNSNGTLTKKRGRGPQQPSGISDCFRVVQLIKDHGFQPVIIFSFSRRDCEALALQMSKINFNKEEEADLVGQVFFNAVESLNAEDQKLPQITAILPLLRKGVGIHHSGLLPIIKEAVELLFQEGLLKCLFATETFAMGLNMPARTVVFTAVRKYDGEKFRHMHAGEYVQMSGRAGRRGLDESGISVLMCDEQIEPTVAKSITSGTAEPLKSSFRLNYNMLLNLMRAEEADPEYVIARSLAQFQADRAVPDCMEKLEKLEEKRDQILVGGGDTGVEEHEVKTYFKLRGAAESLRKEVRDIVHQPSVMLPFLQPGRLVRIREVKSGTDYGWGAIVKFTRRGTGGGKKPEDERFSIDVLLRCFAGSNNGGRPRPWKAPGTEAKELGPSKGRRRSESNRPEWIVVECSFRELDGISALRVYTPNELRDEKSRSSVGRSVLEVLRRFAAGPPMLDPFSDLAIKDQSLPILLRKAEAVDEALLASPVAKCERLRDVMTQWQKKQDVMEKIKDVKKELKVARGIILKEELKRMKRVLRRLGFTNSEGVVEVKGRVACEVNSGDELVITELLLGGSLNEMAPDVLVSLCSCFVLDEGKRDEKLRLEPELQAAYDTLKAVATRVGTVKKESNIVIDVEQYIENFSPNAMRVVYLWCQGKSFSEVCLETDLFEGSVVRCFRRLEELLRQLIAAVKSIQNTELEEKFESGSSVLKRGIAFQASLYV